MDKVEIRARELLGDQIGRTVDQIERLLHADGAYMVDLDDALAVIAAALREQPEARGVVAIYDPESGRAVTADHHDWPESAGFWNVRIVRVTDPALTAAQQPVQGVEYQSQVSDKDTGEVVYPWARCPKAAYDAVSGQPHEGSKLRVEYRILYTAPPSAPVGDRPSWMAEVCRCAVQTMEANGLSGRAVQLRRVADQLAALTQQPAQAAPGDDAKRLDWIESQVRQYGDGYTEPLEASVVVQWQQQKPNDRWPGLRAWVDEEMARTDDWLDGTPPGEDAAGGGHG